MTKNVILESFRLDVIDNAGDLAGIESEWLYLLGDPEFVSNHGANDLEVARKVISRLGNLQAPEVEK